MMITRAEKQIAADQVTQSYLDLENQIMQNIIRHIKDYKKPIDSDDWLMQKLAEVGGLNKENIKLIAKTTGASAKQVEVMCNEVADTVVQRVDDLPDLRDIEKPKKTQTKNVKRAVKTVYDQAKDSLNKCNTNMLYAAQSSYQQLVQGLVSKAKEIANKKDLLDIIGSHATAEAVGAESRGQAIRSVLKAFNDKGIPAFVDKAGRQWTPEAYVSMTLRTTAGNIATEAMNARMDDLGLNLIQVSSHSGARPKCAKDQGKIFDKNGGSGTVEDINGKKIKYYPFSSSSYGEPDGLFGINCGHHGKPFIPGVSRSRWEPTKDLEENDKEYKKMQMQRGLEREVRTQKRLCSLYKEAGDDEAFEEAAVALKAREYKLDDYVNKNGLVRRRDREQVYGFDRSVSAKSIASNKVYTNAQTVDTIKLKDIAIHRSVGARARNYNVLDPATGEYYHFSEGTKIQNAEVFAGRGTKHTLHEEVRSGLTVEFGGSSIKWQHCKGHAVIDYNGEDRPAEVHWFQEATVGKVKFKIKRWEDES